MTLVETTPQGLKIKLKTKMVDCLGHLRSEARLKRYKARLDAGLPCDVMALHGLDDLSSLTTMGAYKIKMMSAEKLVALINDHEGYTRLVLN